MEEQRARQEDEAKKAIDSTAEETAPVQETGNFLSFRRPIFHKVLRQVDLFLDQFYYLFQIQLYLFIQTTLEAYSVIKQTFPC